MAQACVLKSWHMSLVLIPDYLEHLRTSCPLGVGGSLCPHVLHLRNREYEGPAKREVFGKEAVYLRFN